MANIVRNILGVMDDCTYLESSLTIAHLLDVVKIEFETIQYLQDAKLRLNDPQADKWLSDVTSLSREVEDVMLAYRLHLLDMKKDAVADKWQFLQISKRNANKVSDKIRKILSEDSQLTTSPMFADIHSPLIPKQLSMNFTAKRLSAEWTCLSNHMKNLSECLVSHNASKLMTQYLKKVTSDVNKLVREAKAPNIVSFIAEQQKYEAIQALDTASMVGRQKEVRELEHCLMVEEEKLMVVCVTGEPGIGKTTVAAAVYKHIKRHFDCYAWISVSQKSEPTLLQDTLASLLESLSMMDPSNLVELDAASLRKNIRLLLNGKKFLLVLDGLSRLHEWECIRDALPDGCRGKILLTHQYSQISIPSTFTHKLAKLSSENALQLLRKRALLENDPTKFWPLVKSVAMEILKICDGVPFAISMIGGMLSTKQTPSEWITVQQGLKNTHFIPYCYGDLPPVLKSCFLYGSLFPSDQEISCKRLFRLWAAEGFIANVPNSTKEEIAGYQLYELIRRNMFQVRQVGAAGEIKSCQILEQMKVFATKKSETERFCTIMDLEGRSVTEIAHHISMQAKNKISTNVKVGSLNFHEIYTFRGFTQSKDLAHIITSNCTFRLLLVLELHHLPLENLPTAFGDLIILRYLGLRATKLKKFPAALKKLHRLQTLDVRATMIRELPDWLDGMKKLRHLLLAGSFDDKSVKLLAQIEHFVDLQTLSGVKLTEETAKGLRHISQLRKLSVGMIRGQLLVYLVESINQMEFLQSLTIKCAPGEQIHINSWSPPEKLVKLRVGGYAKDLLNVVKKLESLKYLYLWDCAMIQDPLSSLQHLPNLLVLSLCNTYVGDHISSEATSFPKLKKLSILRFKNLNKWGKIMAGSMQKLETLIIAYCPKLDTPPIGFENLTSLQVLQLTTMPHNFAIEVSNIQSKNHLKFSLLVRGTTELSSLAITESRSSNQ